MIKRRNQRFDSIEAIVSANSGMSKELLLEDNRDYKMKNLDAAADLIRRGIREKKKFYIIGDYDVDGIAASGILDMAFKQMGINATVRIPKRFSEGYGLSTSIVDELEDGQFMVTVDNGIAAIDAIKKSKEKGMTVLVTDHHLAAKDEKSGKSVYPDADLILDPNAIPRSADFHGYCGAGIAYRLAVELVGADNPIVPKLTSMAALATLADSVPLVMENRRIVKQGLKALLTKTGTTKGLYALLCALELSSFLTEEDVYFKIAPCINAPSRLMDDGAMMSYALLTYEGPFQNAMEMANQLLEQNSRRKELSAEWYQKVKQYIDASGAAKYAPIIAYMPKIPEGIIGIVASRIAETYHTPCIILGDTQNSALIKGSGRTYGSVNMKDLLDGSSSHLLKYGGHAGAAGLSLERRNLRAFQNSVRNTLRDYQPEPTPDVLYDLKIPPERIKETMNEVLRYAPYGEGNPAPVLYIENMTLIPNGSNYFKPLAEGNGIKLTSAEIEAVSFTAADAYGKLDNPRHVSMIGTLSFSYFMGEVRKRFLFSHVFASEIETSKSPLAIALEQRARARYA